MKSRTSYEYNLETNEEKSQIFIAKNEDDDNFNYVCALYICRKIRPFELIGHFLQKEGPKK